MSIRDRIKRRIAEMEGETVRNISLKAGMSDSMLHKFLTGQTRSMKVGNLEKVAEALGLRLSDLTEDGEPSEIAPETDCDMPSEADLTVLFGALLSSIRRIEDPFVAAQELARSFPDAFQALQHARSTRPTDGTKPLPKDGVESRYE